jgi:glycosyltransferase involved in cell wall biosynthesis
MRLRPYGVYNGSAAPPHLYNPSDFGASMNIFFFYLAVVTLLIWVVIGIELVIGSRSIGFLKDAPSSKRQPSPKVSAIIPACNEERNIREALRSVLNQDYENMEFIIINDRSTDQTGAILTRMKSEDSRLTVLQITELPSGWLGKPHALYYGAQHASGEVFLFTDADVIMHPSTVSKAVSYMLDHQLDHLTIASEIRMPGVLLGMFAAAFGIFFSLYARPWKANNPRSPNYVGIGTFNMIQAAAYRAVGTHQAIAMRPDDDMKLGKLVKKNGYKQNILFGRDMIYVEWYSSLRGLINGLMKNTFAGVDYSITAIVAGSVAQLLLNFWPFSAVLLTTGSTRIINIVIALTIILLCRDGARFHNYQRWNGIGFPVCTLLFIYIMWRAMMTTIINNGIDWRGTHYPLASLKANKI